MANNPYLIYLALAGGLAVGFVIAAAYFKATLGRKLQESEGKAEKFLLEAKREAEAIKKEAELAAKDKVLQLQTEA
ncbi:MAG: DUF3552 domain-containing protein, partial [Nitrospirae bacterium]|nr:DUF3552 domain-containing protein [Nitrospirota bacterium]